MWYTNLYILNVVQEYIKDEVIKINGDYYQKKTQAYRFIDELLGKGLTFDVILYKVQTQFGFSEKFVKARIELIEKVTGGNK